MRAIASRITATVTSGPATKNEAIANSNAIAARMPTTLMLYQLVYVPTEVGSSSEVELLTNGGTNGNVLGITTDRNT